MMKGRSMKPKVMGILNVTPDSFYDKGQFFNLESAVERGIAMWQEGADWLDIGGESSRPGASIVKEEEELDRVIPIIKVLHSKISIPISIDTYKPRVAHKAIEAGATMINDISGFRDPEMVEVAASAGVDVCVMHMQGTPQTMQNAPSYPEGIISHLMSWFEQKVDLLVKNGVKEKNIILDPGIGFGKTVSDNLEIIRGISRLKTLGFPFLIGVSRKSFMGKILNKNTSELLPATLALNTFLIKEGVEFIRVHDVTEHRNIVDFLIELKNT